MATILRFGLFGAVILAVVLALVGIFIAIATLIDLSSVNDRGATASATLAGAFGILSVAVAATTYLAIAVFP